MTTVRDEAKEYEPKTTKLVSDLKSFNITAELQTFEGETKEGKPFAYQYVEVDGENYRVPASVLKQIKGLLEEKPNLTEVKVKRTGTTMNDTSYQVIPLK